MREIVTQDELTMRMGGLEPRIIVAEPIPYGRIVCESASEVEFGPQMRRMSVYVMSPSTLIRATNEVRARWGERPTWDTVADERVIHTGRSLLVPLRFSDGVREWEIRL